MTITPTRRALLAAGAVLPVARPAVAQGFPNRPIRFINPFPAGIINDLVMRTHTEELAAELGQPIVIDVRTGAGGLIGTQQLLHAAPDGHTWLMASLGNLVAPMLTPSGFHPVQAFQGLALVGHSIAVLVVRGDSTARRMLELVAEAKAARGRRHPGPEAAVGGRGSGDAAGRICEVRAPDPRGKYPRELMRSICQRAA